MLLELQALFRGAGLELWLHYGTLLGAVRGGDFITHDKDIDVGLTAPNPERWSAAIREVEAAGFQIVHWTNRKDLVRVRKHGVLVDVCVFVRRRGFLRGYYTCSTHVVRSKYLSSLETCKIGGSDFSVPRNSSGLLADLYGHEWRIPKVGVPGVSRAWFRDTVFIRPDWMSRMMITLISRIYKRIVALKWCAKSPRSWYRSD